MEIHALLSALHTAERLKDTTRHCYTSGGRHESVAEHSWRLYAEMAARETLEAKIFKALDNLEAVIQHNESALSTWAENEYELNLHYGSDKAAFSPYLSALRQLVREETEEKLRTER